MFFTKNKWIMDLVLSLAILFVGFEGGRIYESRTTQPAATVLGTAEGTYDAAANCGGNHSADVGVETPWKELPVVAIPDEVIPAWSYGAEDALLVVDVYLDYQCQYSQQYLRTIFPNLVKMAEAGALRLAVHDFPLEFHENAIEAAGAVRCAAKEGEYLTYVSALIQDAEAADLETPAEQVGLDASALKECAEQQNKAVMADFEAGQIAGISGTPTTVINAHAIAGALPWDVFERLFEEAKSTK